jgi:Arc/MetJ family transcription regulator
MKRFFLAVLFVSVFSSLYAQELRGEVKIELEPVGSFTKVESGGSRTLTPAEAKDIAREDAARYFGAMIYGWSFRYEVGEKARNIEEKLELTAIGAVDPNDPRLEMTEIQVKDTNLYFWFDYRTEVTQQARLAKWKAGMVRSAQGYGQSPLDEKYAALEDAARAALRAALRGGERNRPKEVTGFISLAAFPRYWLYKGQWGAYGRFNIEVCQIQPFAAH